MGEHSQWKSRWHRAPVVNGAVHRQMIFCQRLRLICQCNDRVLPITTIREEKTDGQLTNYLDSYNRDGYVVVPDVFDPERAASACRATMESLFYGMSFEEYLAKSDREGEYAPLETAYGHQFPCGKDPLDGLIENDYLLDLMEAILGTDQIRFLFGGQSSSDLAPPTPFPEGSYRTPLARLPYRPSYSLLSAAHTGFTFQRISDCGCVSSRY